MSFSAYIRYSIWDFLLVCIACVALVYTLFDGFYIDPSLQYSVVPGVAVAGMLAALYAAGFNRISTRIGSIVFALGAIAGLALSIALSDAALTEDTESNYFIFALIILLVPLLAYLLSRRRWGTAVLFVVGTFICSWIQFFYERYELLWMFLFLTSSLALIVYKNYQTSARTATTVGKLSFTAGFGVALATVAVAVGLGSVLWFGVIEGLNPGAVEIKLITEVRALETVPVQGSGDEYLTPRMDLTSDKTNNDERTTDDLKQSEDGRPEPARPRDNAQAEEEQSGSLLGVNLSAITEAFDFEQNSSQAWMFLGLLLLIPVAIAAYFVGRRAYRAHRLKKIGMLAPADQVRTLYQFILGKLGRVGFGMPDGSTVLEFARNTQGAMERMDAVTGTTFSSLTEAYAHVVYGKGEPTDEQLHSFKRYYNGFWKAARVQLGNVKYFFKSFKL